MITGAARTALLCEALLSASLLFAGPGSAQDTVVADSLLWPSWSQRVAALGLGDEPTPVPDWTAPWTAPDVRSRTVCAVGSSVGFATGILAEVVRSEPVQWPPGFDYFPARRWRSLPYLGAAFAEALVCPPPLASPYRIVPESPDP